MTFLVGALGNSSFFPTAVNASTSTPAEQTAAYLRICNAGLPLESLEYSAYVPLTTSEQCRRAVAPTFDPRDPSLTLSDVVYTWFAALTYPTNVEILGAGIYVAQEQYLTTAAAAGSFVGKSVYTSPGVTITKPVVPLPVKVAVSVLLGLQMVALLALAGYIYSTKTFGTRMDAVAVLVLGLRARSKLGGAAGVPRLGRVKESDLKNLEKVDGLEVFREAAGGPTVAGTGADRDVELVEGVGFRMSDETMLSEVYDVVARGISQLDETSFGVFLDGKGQGCDGDTLKRLINLSPQLACC